MKVTVVGLGKIGLPLAVQIAGAGHRVVGLDIDAGVVGLVNDGIPPFPGEADLDVRLAAARSDGSFEATTSADVVETANDVVIIVVPLVVDAAGVPAYDALDAATAAIAPRLSPGSLVSYETTLPVHTTRRRFTPALASGSGLTPGVDLFVCHSPERVFSGRIFSDLRRYPKLVGGIDEASAARAVEFYASALTFDERPDLEHPNGVWDLGSAEAAELAKLAETTYRDINIAFANELARFSEGIGVDVHRVIRASNSQPFSHIHQPGIAVGGHCIPVYPRFLLTNDPSALVPAAARATNDAMPAHAVDRLATAVGPLRGKRVVVLGAAYRGGVKETAFSGVFGVVDRLGQLGAHALVHDPLYSDDELERLGFTPYHLGEPCEAAIVQADHEGYRQLGPDELPGAAAVLDGRRIVDPGVWGDRLLVLGRG